MATALFLLCFVAVTTVQHALAIPAASWGVVPNDHPNDHSHSASISLSSYSGAWFQQSNHPVHRLFRRGPTDGEDYPEVGSEAWAAGFPRRPADVGRSIPQEWRDALNAAVEAGLIPDLPPSDGNGRYPGRLTPASPEVCSTAAGCRGEGDIWDGPDGVFWSSFDDGPAAATPLLNEFLAANNESTTHFMIGLNILAFPDLFLQCFEANHDIAVHTWSHRHTTSLSNEEVVGELGWTMQMIHNSTGGRVPRYWRPPYGDSDNRVRAIAREVFGMNTVIWNHDSADWTEHSPGPIASTINGFLDLPKSPGLVVLNHELSEVSVRGFIRSYPNIRAQGWIFRSMALLGLEDGYGPYQNSDGAEEPVTRAGVLLGSLEEVTSTSVLTTPTETTSETQAPDGTTTPEPSQPDDTNGAVMLSPLTLEQGGALLLGLCGLLLTQQL